jgi:hypothetical protein
VRRKGALDVALEISLSGRHELALAAGLSFSIKNQRIQRLRAGGEYAEAAVIAVEAFQADQTAPDQVPDALVADANGPRGVFRLCVLSHGQRFLF